MFPSFFQVLNVYIIRQIFAYLEFLGKHWPEVKNKAKNPKENLKTNKTPTKYQNYPLQTTKQTKPLTNPPPPNLFCLEIWQYTVACL